MRNLLSGLLVISVGLVLAISGCNSSRIQIANTGSGIVEIQADDSAGRLLLGQGGTGYFGCDSRLYIGDALIKVNEHVEVQNSGSDIIQIKYHDLAGSAQTMLIGEGGIGYMDKAVPFKIGDADIRISQAQ